MSRLHIKKGDTVRVLSGDDRGKSGLVLRVFPKKMTAIVEGCRIATKHVKPNTDQSLPGGGLKDMERPINVSNLMVMAPGINKPTRVSRIKNEKGFSVRVAKKGGEIIA